MELDFHDAIDRAFVLLQGDNNFKKETIVEEEEKDKDTNIAFQETSGNLVATFLATATCGYLIYLSVFDLSLKYISLGGRPWISTYHESLVVTALAPL